MKAEADQLIHWNRNNTTHIMCSKAKTNIRHNIRVPTSTDMYDTIAYYRPNVSDIHVVSTCVVTPFL